MDMSGRRALIVAALGCALGCGPSVDAVAQAAAHDETGPSQVALSQTQIDDLIGAEKDIHAIEPAGGQDGAQNGAQDEPAPGTEAKLAAVAKAHGFDSLAQMTNVSFSIGLVMAGLDPETKTFVGEPAMLRKQIAQLKAQTGMAPQQKAEALAELEAALKQGDAEAPMPANIAIVKANVDKLGAVVETND